MLASGVANNVPDKKFNVIGIVPVIGLTSIHDVDCQLRAVCQHSF
jgi:hypothetical protein